MKRYSEYEDSFVWDLYNEIVFLLEDMRRIMFLKGLEDLNERSIQYFENIRRIFYDENKILDTEMVLTATARWLAIVQLCKPRYFAIAQDFIASKFSDSSIYLDTENLSYHRLLSFIHLGHEEFEINPYLERSDRINNIGDVIEDLFIEKQQNESVHSKIHNSVKTLNSYTWLGRPDELKELYNLLTNYLKPCEFENFSLVFSGHIPNDFKQIEWIANANELLYLITQMMNYGLIPVEKRLNYIRIDSCFTLTGREPVGDKWRFQKQRLDEISQSRRDSLDWILGHCI
jgi:hypothetical protein